MTTYILQALSWIIQFLIIVIFIRAIISWLPIDRGSQIFVILDRLSEPVIAPLRRIVPRLGRIDITPLVAIILLQILDSVVKQMMDRSF